MPRHKSPRTTRSSLFRTLVRALRAAQHANRGSAELPPRAAQTAWTRRRFLHTTAAAAPALALTGLSRGAWALPAGKPGRRVAVVGGGIAGLNATYRLMRAGVEVALYEASGRLGGRIRSSADTLGDNLVVELGGEFINSNHDDMRALAGEFGLSLFNRRDAVAPSDIAPTAYVLAGKVRTEEELARLLRPLAAQIGKDADHVEKDYDRYAPALDKLSVSDYLDRHAKLIPEPFIRTLIALSIRTEYGVEPAQSSALQLLYNLPTVSDGDVEMLGDSDEAFTIVGGNGRLIDALGQALGERVQRNRRLVGVDTRGGAGVRLSFHGGHVVEADYAILAMPFTVLRSVTFDAPLPTQLRRFIAEATLGSNDKVIAGFAERVWRRPAGFTGEAWTDLGFAEVWDATQRQPELAAGALTFFMGGKEVATKPPAADVLGQEFVDRLDQHVSGAKPAATGRFVRTDWSGNPFSRGAYTSFRPGQLTRFADLLWIEAEDPEEAQEVRAGKLLFAGEHLSDEYFGFMNGGAQTGRLAADAVLELLGLSGGAGATALRTAVVEG